MQGKNRTTKTSKGLVLMALLLAGLTSGGCMVGVPGENTDLLQTNARAANANARPQQQNKVIWLESFKNFDPSNYIISSNGCHQWNAQEEVFHLTTTSQFCRTSMFLNRQVPVGNFELHFDLRIEGGTAADGLAFLFVRDYNYSRVRDLPPYTDVDIAGGWLDFHGADGYAVEFDTYYNRHWDPTARPHISVLESSTENSLAYAEQPNLRDGNFHHVRIRLENGKIGISFDGKPTLSYTFPSFQPFDGYVGFSSGTGALHDYHTIDNIRLTILKSGN